MDDFSVFPGLSVEEFLYRLRAGGVKAGLEPARAALDALGAPDREMIIVQIAGSVGKGSVAAMLSSILISAGIRTALYTSPHLVEFNERFQVDGNCISKKIISGTLREIISEIPWATDISILPASFKTLVRQGRGSPDSELRPLTFFEWATVLGCLLFRNAGVEVAVLETGLGGRWDAVTACRAELSCITRLDLEHTGLLGNSLAQIAYEKAGVIRKGKPVITLSQSPEALKVIKDIAEERKSPLYIEGVDFSVQTAPDMRFDYRGDGTLYRDLKLSLPGKHQLENASIAIKAAELLEIASLKKILSEAVEKGLSGTRLPGRIEQIQSGLWFDGSHTGESVRALVNFIRTELPGGKAHLVFGALNDKNINNIVELLEPAAASFTFCSAGTDRAVNPDDILPIVSGWNIPCRVIKNPNDAVREAMIDADNFHTVVCGSFYLIGALKAAMRNCNADPGDPPLKILSS